MNLTMLICVICILKSLLDLNMQSVMVKVDMLYDDFQIQSALLLLVNFVSIHFSITAVLCKDYKFRCVKLNTQLFIEEA